MASSNSGIRRNLTHWSDDELAAAVVAYLTMLRGELEGQLYIKSAFNRVLREGVLSNRTEASIEFRMQNISATLYDLRVPHIVGYLPAKNVGNAVKERIKSVLKTNGVDSFAAYIPTADHIQLSDNVSALRKRPLGKTPLGSSHPVKVTATITTFVCDPNVKRWVLEVAAGACEGCTHAAPFLAMDGYPYLEVHHVVPLSASGSDRITNAVALCPNCHRRCHFAIDRDEFKLSLYERIARLRVEVVSTDDLFLTVSAEIDLE